jgi:hypothetical protein
MRPEDPFPSTEAGPSTRTEPSGQSSRNPNNGPNRHPNIDPPSALNPTSTRNTKIIDIDAIRKFIWDMHDRREEIKSQGITDVKQLQINLSSALNEPKYVDAKNSILNLCAKHPRLKDANDLNWAVSCNRNIHCFDHRFDTYILSRPSVLIKTISECERKGDYTLTDTRFEHIWNQHIHKYRYPNFY